LVINVEHPTSRPASGFINKSLVGGPDTFVGILLEQANSEKKMKLFVKRIAKKTGISEKDLLALKP